MFEFLKLNKKYYLYFVLLFQMTNPKKKQITDLKFKIRNNSIVLGSVKIKHRLILKTNF